MAAAAPGAAFPMDVVTAEKEIFQLVCSSDLAELTSSKVRKHLQEQFGLDFSEYKNKVNDMTRRAIEKMQSSKTENADDSDESSDDSSDEEENVQKEETEETTKKQSSSDSDSDTGLASTDRKKKKKKTASQTPEPEFVDMMSTIKSSRRAAATKACRDIRKSAGVISRRKKEKGDKDEDNSGKFGRMTKLCYISPELQEVVGNKYMKRCDVVKVLWDYIKENDLKDPKNKKNVICDEKLEVIFKKKKFIGFSMTKFLTKHIIEPKLLGPEYEKEANDEMSRLRAEWLERKMKREEEMKAQENKESGEPAEKKAKVEDEDD